MALAIFFVGSSTLSEKTFLEERMTMIISSEEKAKMFYTCLYNHSDCKRALQGSTAQSGKNRKKIKYCFHCPKGFPAASILAAFSMRKYFDQIVGDLTDKIIEVNYGF